MNDQYIILPYWILKDDTFEEFCEKFEDSWIRLDMGGIGIIGFELSSDGVEPGLKYTIRAFRN